VAALFFYCLDDTYMKRVGTGAYPYQFLICLIIKERRSVFPSIPVIYGTIMTWAARAGHTPCGGKSCCAHLHFANGGLYLLGTDLRPSSYYKDYI
jgi:hypothetical protein